MKALYALVFVLFSFAAPAGTLETWLAAYFLEDLDCLGKATQQSTTLPQIDGIELLCAAMLNDADVVATTGSIGTEDVPVVQPSDEGGIAAYASRSADQPTVDDTSEQSAMPAQIIATEPTIEKPGEVTRNDADDIVITGSNDPEDVPVGAIQPSDENSTVKYSTGNNGKLTVDDPIEQSAMPAQIIATEPTIEKPGEVTRNDADDIVITGPNDAEDVPVGAIQPSDENSTVKSDQEACN
jgi:hypothetical protein